MANRYSIETVFKAIDNMTAPVNRMQNSVRKFTRSVDRGLKNANRSVDNINQNLFKLGTVGLASAGVAAFALQRQLAAVADEADRLAKLSRRIGFPIEELQEWTFVASQAGVSSSLFESSIGAFTKRLGEARAGTGALVTMLKKSNPELLKQILAANSTSEAFNLLVNAMRDTENASDRAALASAAFSRAGMKLSNIADMSADAISELRKQQRLNGIVTEEQAAAAEAYNDAIDSATRAVTGLRNDALAPLMPMLTDGIKQFRLWTIANRDLIATKTQDFIRLVIDNAGNFFTIAKGLVQVLAGWLAITIALKVATLAFNLTMIAANVVMFAWSASTKALAISMGIFKGVLTAVRMGVLLFNAALYANPIGLIVGLIVGLIAAGVLLYKNWDKVSGFMSGVWDKIKESAKSGIDFVLKVLDKVAAPFEMIFAGIKRITGSASAIKQYLFGGDSEEESAEGSANVAGGGSRQVVTGAEQVARSIEERSSTTRNEVVIRDDTGRAETQSPLPNGVSLMPSGAF